jgi:anti-anti-sigma regulatory factor
MNAAAASESVSAEFALPTVMTIETAEDLLATLKERATGALTLDASATETLTTPGVQLLISLAKKLEAAGGKLLITGEKPAFAQVFEQLGLASHLTSWRTS